MRIFLFLCSALSLLLSAHQFSLAEPSGQYKGALILSLDGHPAADYRGTRA